MADAESIIVAPPMLTQSGHGVKKRARKAGKAFDAVSYGVRRSIRLVIAESIEYARGATAKATPSSSSSSSASSSPSTASPSPTSSGVRSTRSTRSTRSMLPTPSMPTMPTSPNTTTTTTMTCTTPETDEQDDPRRSPLVPTKRKNWYRIKGIINEATRGGKTSYLVEWEGYDPSTGLDWPAEWLDSSAVSKPAVKVWKRERDAYMASI